MKAKKNPCKQINIRKEPPKTTPVKVEELVKANLDYAKSKMNDLGEISIFNHILKNANLFEKVSATTTTNTCSYN